MYRLSLSFVLAGLVIAAVSVYAQDDAPSTWQADAPSLDAGLIAEVARLKARVAAFDNAIVGFVRPEGDCPHGWRPYPQAEGRFLRGIDPDSDIDTEIENGKPRSPGHLQDDALAGHEHKMRTTYGGRSAGPDEWALTFTGTVGHNLELKPKSIGPGSVSNETRPKNVAVRFCVHARPETQ